MKTLRQRYPFSAIVGQEELKQALLLNLVTIPASYHSSTDVH